MKFKFTQLQNNGTTKKEIVDIDVQDLRELANRILVIGKTIEVADYDRGFLILSNGIVAEDIEQNKRFKEMLKYM